MFRFFQFIEKYQFSIVFLVLQTIAIYLLVSFNASQSKLMNNTLGNFNYSLQQRKNNVSQYFSLQQEIEKVRQENAILRRRLAQIPPLYVDSSDVLIADSISLFEFIPCKVVSNELHKRENTFVILGGTSSGIQEGMGVLSPNGVVGFVKQVGDRYSRCSSILNEKVFVSATIDSSQALGKVQWRPHDIRGVNLLDIPRHIDVRVGAEVVTSGYSFFFPKGIPIGKISDVSYVGGDDHHTVFINLAQNMKDLSAVYVLKNKDIASFKAINEGN